MAVGGSDDPRLTTWNREMLAAHGLAALDRRVHLVERTIGVAAKAAEQSAVDQAAAHSDAGDATVTSGFQTADTSLQGQINTEATNRFNTDVSLQSNINAKLDISFWNSEIPKRLLANVAGTAGWSLSWGYTTYVLGANSIGTVTMGSPFGTTASAAGTIGVDWQEASQVGLGCYWNGSQLLGKHINNSGNSVTLSMFVLFVGQ